MARTGNISGRLPGGVHAASIISQTRRRGRGRRIRSTVGFRHSRQAKPRSQGTGYGPLVPALDETTGLPLLIAAGRVPVSELRLDRRPDGRTARRRRARTTAWRRCTGRAIASGSCATTSKAPGRRSATCAYDPQAGGGTTTIEFDRKAGEYVTHDAEPERHGPQLRGRPDAVGLVADVRGNHALQRGDGHAARLHLRRAGRRRRRSRADSRHGPLLARGRRRRSRHRLRLRDRGRRQLVGLLSLRPEQAQPARTTAAGCSC